MNDIPQIKPDTAPKPQTNSESPMEPTIKKIEPSSQKVSGETQNMEEGSINVPNPSQKRKIRRDEFTRTSNCKSVERGS